MKPGEYDSVNSFLKPTPLSAPDEERDFWTGWGDPLWWLAFWALIALTAFCFGMAMHG